MIMIRKYFAISVLFVVSVFTAHSQSLDFTEVFEVSKMEAPKHGGVPNFSWTNS